MTCEVLCVCFLIFLSPVLALATTTVLNTNPTDGNMANSTSMVTSTTTTMAFTSTSLLDRYCSEHAVVHACPPGWYCDQDFHNCVLGVRPERLNIHYLNSADNNTHFEDDDALTETSYVLQGEACILGMSLWVWFWILLVCTIYCIPCIAIAAVLMCMGYGVGWVAQHCLKKPNDQSSSSFKLNIRGQKGDPLKPTSSTMINIEP